DFAGLTRDGGDVVGDAGEVLLDLRRQAFIAHAAFDARGDVAGEFHDLHRTSIAVEDGVVAGLDPDRAVAGADALVFAGLVFAAAQRVPERHIFRLCSFGRVHEHAVM